MTPQGRFVISENKNADPVFDLSIYKESGERDQLEIFQTIKDAFIAVQNQQTGDIEWDTLDPNEIPHRLFDLMCWDYNNFSGTIQNSTCSIPIG